MQISKPYHSLRTEHQLEKVIKHDDDESLLNFLNNKISPNFCFSSMFLFEPNILKNNPSLLAVSVYYGSEKCTKVLLNNNADLNFKDSLHVPLQHFAVAGGHIETLVLLSDLGMSFQDCLFIAAESGNFETFMWLYSTQITDLSQRMRSGVTLLQAAIKSGNNDLIKFLTKETYQYLNYSDIFLIINELNHQIQQYSDDSDDEGFSENQNESEKDINNDDNENNDNNNQYGESEEFKQSHQNMTFDIFTIFHFLPKFSFQLTFFTFSFPHYFYDYYYIPIILKFIN